MPTRTASQRSAKARLGKRAPPASYAPVLTLIGLFKLCKALLLVAVGIGAHHLLHKDLAATVLHWVTALRVDPDNHYVHRLLIRIFRINARQLRELSVGTFLYAGLFATEGIGLLLHKRWAEYFTIVTTAGLIPLEIFELVRHVTVAKIVISLVNVLIVLYLIRRVRSR